jgi:hypothetical protein
MVASIASIRCFLNFPLNEVLMKERDGKLIRKGEQPADTEIHRCSHQQYLWITEVVELIRISDLCLSLIFLFRFLSHTKQTQCLDVLFRRWIPLPCASRSSNQNIILNITQQKQIFLSILESSGSHSLCRSTRVYRETLKGNKVP